MINIKRIVRSCIRAQKALSLRSVFLLSIFLIIDCSTEPEVDSPAIDFYTTKTSYSTSDTLTVVVSNDSSEVFIYALRGGLYLEMFYQKEENGEWSENQWLWYMSTMMPTVLDSIQPGEIYAFDLPADWLEDIGTFRFVMDEKYTNRFKIN